MPPAQVRIEKKFHNFTFYFDRKVTKFNKISPKLQSDIDQIKKVPRRPYEDYAAISYNVPFSFITFQRAKFETTKRHYK